MADHRQLRLGTRASALARWQANWVAERLTAAGCPVELVPIATHGDAQQHDPIGALGGTGLFTKELQRALLDRRIDLAVHSLKDLPTEPVAGLRIGAVPEREDVADVLICRQAAALEQLPRGALVGTGSLRRRAQLLYLRNDLQMRDIRGNVDTRLRKLHEGQFDAIVLAAAGLKRLGLSAAITQVFQPEQVLSAVGQGALGIEIRDDDSATAAAVRSLDHVASHQAVLAERALLATLLGGCLAPVAAWARPAEVADLKLTAVVLSPDGAERIKAERIGPSSDPAALGQGLAYELLAAGAGRLIEAARTMLGRSNDR